VKKFRMILFLSVILSMALFSYPAFGAPGGQASDNVPDQILVKFKQGIPDVAKQQIHTTNQASVVGEIRQLGVHVVRVPGGNVSERVQAYLNNPAVEYAEPDYIATVFETPNDTYFPQQWGMTKIQAQQAWDTDTGLASIKIAVLDTGVDQNHEDLAGKIVSNKNFTLSSTYDDFYGHGTHVAGIAAAVTNNGIGVAGTGYDCSIMNGKVLDDSGSGAYSWIASGITWAADSGADVINMSLGGKFGSSTLQNAVNYAWGKGVVVVAAAGNDGSSRANYPAYYTNCIAVAASDSNDAKASFSNYGSWVDVAAPGVGIYSTLPNHSNSIGNDYGSLNGTSMATPHVAGLAGLVWASSYGANNAAVRDRIENTADQAGTIWTTYGIERINAYSAVAAAAPPPTDTTPPVISNLNAAPSSNTAIITWATDESADARVDYGTSTSYGAFVSDAALATTHSLTLTGLAPATIYYYQVSSKDAAGNSATQTGSFTTAAEAELAVSVTTDKPEYTGNTFVYITVTVTDPTYPVPGVTVDLTVTSPASKTSSYTGTTNSAGQAVFNYRVNKNSVKGTYTATATAGTATGSTTFLVK
jgi:thermitase